MLTFALLTWGIAFLVADAMIFGCSTRHYKDELEEENHHEAEEMLQKVGALKIRNPLLRVKFFRELFSCYFCLGFWCGIVAHLLLRFVSVGYFIAHESTLQGWTIGLAVAAVLGAALCYLVDLLVGALEKLQQSE